MTELTIYDSQGKSYEANGTERPKELIKNFFFGGVKLYAEFGSQTKLIVFFRAQESNTGRAEQYYAVYQTRASRNLFKQFKSDLRDRVEREYGMTIQTDAADVDLFTSLDQQHGRVPGTDFDHDLIPTLLNSGQRLRFGVSTTGNALGLFEKYSQRPAQRIAIAENTGIEELDQCDLGIEIGDYSGLEPVGDTERKIQEGRRQMEGKFVQQKMSAIKQDINELRSHTTKSDRQLRNRLKREVSILESPSPKELGQDSQSGLLSGLSRPARLGVSAVGGVLALGIVLLLIVNVLAVAGFGSVLPSFVGSFALLGDEQADPMIEDVTAEGEELVELTENGEFKESVTVTPSNENIHVSGTTNQDYAQVAYIPSGNDTASSDDRVGVTDNTFELTLSDVESGSGELIIQGGSFVLSDSTDSESSNTGSESVEGTTDENYNWIISEGVEIEFGTENGEDDEE
ncbi:hypothetical protein ACLI4Z_07540 [Natrialbaceae archaeon A-arb3/5]